MVLKRIRCIIVSVALTVCYVPNIVLSVSEAADTEESTVISGDWEYILTNGGARAVKYHSNEAETDFRKPLILPTELDGHKVVSFAAGSFSEDIENYAVEITDNTVDFDENWLDGSSINYLLYDDMHFMIIDYGGKKVLELDRWSKKTTDYQDISVPVIIECGSAVEMPLSAPKAESYVYDVTVPEKVGGYTVEDIKEAFTSANNIRSLTLPDTITYLSQYSFQDSSIQSINIPRSVRYIPDNCFKGCTQLRDVSFHDDILIVSSKAFIDSPDVKIPQEYDDPYAFATSSNLYAYGTKRVGDWVLYLNEFSGKELAIGLNEYLGSDTVLTIPKAVGDYTINSKVNSAYILSNNKTVKEINFENGVKFIPNMGSTVLRKVTLPDNITELAGQFNGCTALTSIVLPSSIKKISGLTFNDCSSLSEVIIESDEITIDGAPFYGTAIKKLELPGNCVIYNSALPTSLEELVFGSGDKVSIYSGKSSVLPNLKNVVFSPAIKETDIQSGSFRSSGIENIAFPDGKVNIFANAFRGCTDLKEVEINGDTVISSNAFSECDALEKVVLNGKCDISELAFSSCPNLAEVDFDISQNISGRCFNSCPNLFLINSKEVIPQNSTEPVPEFKSYFYENCQTAHEVGFVDRFTMNNVKKAVEDTIDDSMSDIEKVKALHDWICSHTVYDDKDVDYLGNHVDSSIFFDGAAVCEGYASTYNLLLHEAGIESCFVDTGTHAWNLVKIGDSWFHIDTTWDDGENISYDWFLCPDSEMQSGSHEGFKLRCPSELHNFQPKELPICNTLMGDVDKDGNITISDIQALRAEIISGSNYFTSGDLNFDGKLSSADIACLLKRLPDCSHMFGDVNGDSKVDSVDASLILAEYSRLSTGSEAMFNEEQIVSADINADSRTDSTDASMILSFYSFVSTGGTADIADYI